MTSLVRMQRGSLPELPYDAWEHTHRSLHLYCQVIGKLRLAGHPKLNHWWHITLRVSPLGLTTGRVESSGGPFQVDLDLHAHRVIVTRWDGRSEELPFSDGPSLSDFHAGLVERLQRLDIDVRIEQPTPYDVPGESLPFDEDDRPREYDGDAVHRYWVALAQVEGVLREFGSRFIGKQSPPQLFWHHFDLAMARYSGREAPVAEDASRVEREAYSHEVIASGWWPGDPEVREAAFYSYIAPMPDGYMSHPLAGAGAFWVKDGGQARLPYDAVRTAADPRREVLAFFESAYQAGANAAQWPRTLDAEESPRRDAGASR